MKTINLHVSFTTVNKLEPTEQPDTELFFRSSSQEIYFLSVENSRTNLALCVCWGFEFSDYGKFLPFGFQMHNFWFT